MVVDKILKAKEKGFLPVVVVSAMGRRKDEPYATDTLLSLVSPQFKQENLLAVDLLLNCGEILSAVTMCNELFSRNIKAIPLTGGQAGIITNKDYVNKIKDLIPEIDEKNMYIEPENKETAACIGLAAINIYKRDKNAIIVALPSDHIIGEKDRFIELLDRSVKIVKYNNFIATIGIKPNRPETAYGYIEREKIMDKKCGFNVYKVASFLEKPNKEKAIELLKTQKYLWNSGMFIFKAEYFLGEMKKYLPDTHGILMNIYKYVGDEHKKEQINKLYSKIKPISIDYGIMEKAKSICVIEGDILWDDVGSWSALERFFEKDSRGNIVKGLSSRIDTKECIIYGDDRLIATIGVENLIIVDTGDAVLICDKKRDQDIKNLVKNIIQDNNLNKFL
jgi:mannose-1-phosphate guanylyltransferase